MVYNKKLSVINVNLKTYKKDNYVNHFRDVLCSSLEFSILQYYFMLW